MAPRKPLSIRKPPSQDRSRKTVQAILEAATQVFLRRGYAAATTAHIAQRAGVSVGSLYQYFPNKESLLAELGQRHVAASHQLVQRALDECAHEGRSLRETIRALVEAMLELHLAEAGLHRLLFEEIPRQPPIRAAKEASERELLGRIEQMLRRHCEVRVRRLPVATAFVGQVVESLTHWYVLESPGLRLERRAFAEELTALVHAYLSDGGA